MEQITTSEPRPPRQIDDTIPKELERICLKALSKRASERYSTARDMAEDLALVPPSHGVSGLDLRPPAASADAPARIDPGIRSTSDHLQAIRLRPATDQDRPEGAAILR